MSGAQAAGRRLVIRVPVRNLVSNQTDVIAVS